MRARNRKFEVAPSSLDRSFRTFLQREFIARCKKNPRYSIRAFAVHLGINNATLSTILSGNRKVSYATLSRLGLALGLSPIQIQEFWDNSEEFQSHKRANEQRINRAYLELTNDIFAAVSDWYHDAILELAAIDGFVADPAWISKKLSINSVEASSALERLVRLNLLVQDSSGKWTPAHENDTTVLDPNYTTEARKRYQKQILELSLLAIDHTPVEIRDHTSVTLAIKVSDIPLLKEKLKKLRREFSELAQRPGVKPDAVYQLSVGFFPLTNNKKENL